VVDGITLIWIDYIRGEIEDVGMCGAGARGGGERVREGFLASEVLGVGRVAVEREMVVLRSGVGG
jgi:hypothetical protein